MSEVLQVRILGKGTRALIGCVTLRRGLEKAICGGEKYKSGLLVEDL